MIERLVSKRGHEQPTEPIKRLVSKRVQQTKKAGAKRAKLTKGTIDRLECPEDRQDVIWDKEQKGLSILLSKSVKSFRATYRLRGKTVTTVIGRVGEMELDEARDTVGQYRRDARKGIDPKGPKPGTVTYAEVVDRFIEGYAKPNQRTWHQTEAVLKRGCSKLAKRPFDAITRDEVMSMLDGFAVQEKKPYKASVALSHLKRLWRWAVQRGTVSASILDNVTNDYERHSRDRVYTDDEVRNIWRAAEQMSVVEGAYFKLLLLLAPRIAALAWMQRSHLDDVDEPRLWTTPHELTKSRKRLRNPKKRRVYQTPLPGLATRILKGLRKGSGDDQDPLVFPGLPRKRTKGEGYEILTNRLVRQLKRRGAPQDFYPHAFRHTISTWLENEGHSEWERSLVLNHASSSVTGNYSHGFAGKLKLELLEKWAAHVELLVQPAGVALLR